MRSRIVWTGLAFSAVIVGVLLTPSHPPHVERHAAGVSPSIDTTSAPLGTTALPFVEVIQNEEPPPAEPETSSGMAPARSAPIVADAGTGASEAPASECALAEAIRAAWAGTGDEEWAVSVAWRESHCGPGARNPSGASGIFQLMMPLHRALIVHVCGEDADALVFDADCNIRAARALYDGSGRRPWAF